ncbi:MAG: hypothetical protein GX452_10230, partial [Ignavibacteriales bacterium]|nr:hypothetical protein [Ignavibacteriales bacterium]
MKKKNYRRIIKDIELKYKKQVVDLAQTESAKLITDYLKEFDHVLLKYGDE